MDVTSLCATEASRITIQNKCLLTVTPITSKSHAECDKAQPRRRASDLAFAPLWHSLVLPSSPTLTPQQASTFLPGKYGIAQQIWKQLLNKQRRMGIRSDLNTLWNLDAWTRRGEAMRTHGNPNGNTSVVAADLCLVISLVRALGLKAV